MRAWLGNVRAEGRSVGLVPTMGAFHAGHHSLMRAAREEQDSVVVSLFVNPAQFNDAARPRRLPAHRGQRRRRGGRARRRRPVRAAGERDLPRRASPRRSRSRGLSEVLEGAERGPGHFAGVCTVVNKLLNIVAPDVAYFGQKDAQQVAVVKRMVRDLDMPVADRGPADRARAGRPRAVLAQRPPLARRPRPRARPLPRAERRRATPSPPASATPTRSAPPRWPRSATSTPSTSRSSTPSPSPRCAPSPRPHAGRGRGAGRPRPPDRQHRPRTRPGGDRLSRRQPLKGASNVHPTQGPAQARDAHQARRDARAGRADRDDHRLRPPERARGRGGRRRRRPRRRLARPTTCSATPTPCRSRSRSC